MTDGKMHEITLKDFCDGMFKDRTWEDVEHSVLGDYQKTVSKFVMNCNQKRKTPTYKEIQRGVELIMMYRFTRDLCAGQWIFCFTIPEFWRQFHDHGVEYRKGVWVLEPHLMWMRNNLIESYWRPSISDFSVGLDNVNIPNNHQRFYVALIDHVYEPFGLRPGEYQKPVSPNPVV